MESSRKSITKRLLIVVCLLLFVFGGLYAYANRFSADEVSLDTDFLAGFKDQPDSNDPTLIRLPEIYSKDEIEKALTSQSQVPDTKGSAAKDKEIVNQIRSQANRIASSLPLQAGTKERPAMNDLVFTVADYEGKLIFSEPSTGGEVSTATKAKSVADNFIFDPTVTDRDKKLMLDAYPIIESIYGPRQNSDKITVFCNINIGRGWYAANHIELDSSNRVDVPIHELVHAFHGYRTVRSLWEEGFATAITTYAEKEMDLRLDEYFITQEGYGLNFESLVSTYDDNMDQAGSPWLSNLPYAYGSMILEKISLEDMGFFKKFNQQLYALKALPSSPTLLRIAASSVAKIEGEDSWVWFAKQYPYIPLYENSFSPNQEMYFATLADSSWYFEPLADRNRFYLRIHPAFPVEDGDFEVRVLDKSNNVLIAADEIVTSEEEPFISGILKYCGNVPQKYKDYIGLIKVEITPTNNPNNKKVQHFLKPVAPGQNDVYIYNKTGTKAIFTSLDSSDTETVTRTNGLFALSADWIRRIGRYKVEIYDSKDKKLNEKYFNKGEVSDLFISLAESNICKDQIKSVNPLNRGFILNSVTQVDCGHIIMVNRVPIYRYWGKNINATVSSLAKGRKYNYQISTASDSSKTKTIFGSVTTALGPDFRLVKSESLGSPADNSFKLRLTFSSPYNFDSIRLWFELDVSEKVELDYIKVSSTILDVVPRTKIYNGATYRMIGLSKTVDLQGNPIFDVGYAETFQTELNPIDGVSPFFGIERSIVSVGENLAINTNFDTSAFFQANRTVVISGCFGLGSPSKGGNVCPDFQSTITKSGSLILVDAVPTLSAGEYTVTFPATVDDKNNYVWGRDFQFTVE